MAQLKIMSFNLRVNSAKDGVNMWPARAELAANLIRKYAPDVIGFQELQLVHWDSLVTLLPEYGRAAGPKCDNQEPFAYPSLFWNVDRLHLLASGGAYLSETPDRFSGSWQTAYVRGMVWAQLRLNDLSGARLLVCNAHLDNASAAARLGQTGVLIDQAARHRVSQQPVFVLGDFNCQPGSPPYQALQTAGYRDLFIEAGGVDGPHVGSFHNYTGATQPQWGRIDWIFGLSGTQPGSVSVRATAGEILQDAAPPLYPSDHFPVMASVQVAEIPLPPPPRK